MSSGHARHSGPVCLAAIFGIFGLSAACSSAWHIGALGKGIAEGGLVDDCALVVGWIFGVILSGGIALGAAVATVALVLFGVAGLRVLTARRRKRFRSRKAMQISRRY